MTTGCMLSTQHSCQRARLALWGKHRASTIPFTLEKPGACELCPGTAVGRKGTLLPPRCPEAAAASSAGHWEPHTKAPLGADAKQCQVPLPGPAGYVSPTVTSSTHTVCDQPCLKSLFWGVHSTLGLLMPKGSWLRSPRTSLGWKDRQTLLLQPRGWDACHFLWREH